MPRWLTKVVARTRRLAETGQVGFTIKARAEIAALGAPFDQDECTLVLMSLRPDEFTQRVWSEPSFDWLYVFRPCVHGVPLYVKVALRHRCLVVSFHAEEDDHAE